MLSGRISCIFQVEAAGDDSEKCEQFTMANETNSNLTPEEMAARIAELEGRLAKGSSLSFKVSEKGAVSRSISGRPLLGAMVCVCFLTLPSFANLSRPISRD